VVGLAKLAKRWFSHTISPITTWPPSPNGHPSLYRATEGDSSYHRNMDKVVNWLRHLRHSEPRHPYTWTDDIRDILPDIEMMLSVDPARRPKAAGLWARFKHVSRFVCARCGPRLRISDPTNDYKLSRFAMREVSVEELE
jgi:hypothetical protein